MLFTRGPSITVRLVLLVLASILLMTLDHKQQHLQTVRAGLQVVVYPIRYLVNLPVDVAQWASENFSSRQNLIEENASLRYQNLLLQAQMQKFDALQAENRRLQELLGSSFKVADRVLIAELYRVDLDPYRQLIVINKGSTDHAYVDQPVLDAHGVMGQVIQVGPLTATVRLVTDPSHIIPIQDNRNGLRTLAVGTGAINRLELPYLPNNAEIRKGDLLVTSGLGGVFPPGYPVARVTKVVRDPGSAFAKVTATPTAHLDRSREVLLVWSGDTDKGKRKPYRAAGATPDKRHRRPVKKP
ncbi:MAG: rod shape-determining protein MreC [Gammaproteobacteria bacterium]